MSEKRELVEADRLRLAAWGAAGARLVDVAANLAMSPTTLRALFARDELAARAWAMGRAELHEKLASKLIEKALKGDTVSLLFSLKCLFGYVEGQPLDADRTASLVTINLPAAASPEQYAKLIELAPSVSK